jgi:hypothetical protein
MAGQRLALSKLLNLVLKAAIQRVKELVDFTKVLRECHRPPASLRS